MVGGDDPPFVEGRPVTRRALQWARELHAGQVREVDRAEFILHPLEVGALLSGRGFEDDVVAAGLLHDAVEDTDVEIDEIRARLGERVAHIVAAMTEDAGISNYDERKSALRRAVGEAELDVQAVYAADKVVKARELRAQAAHAARMLDQPDVRRRLEHYELSLAMLETAAPELPLVRQLSFELWALRTLPPRP